MDDAFLALTEGAASLGTVDTDPEPILTTNGAAR
jgi:hypothetical protein